MEMTSVGHGIPRDTWASIMWVKTWNIYNGEAIPPSSEYFRFILLQEISKRRCSWHISYLASSKMSHVLATAKESDTVEFCQRVRMKSGRGKNKTVIILIVGQEFHRGERLNKWPKTHSISEIKLMRGAPPRPGLCCIWAWTTSAFFTVIA